MTNLHSHEDPARQPSEFDIRRAELVGQIGDVSRQYHSTQGLFYSFYEVLPIRAP